MEEERIKCPYCSELIFSDAVKCHFCKEWLTEEKKPAVNGGPKELPAAQVIEKSLDERELKEAAREPGKDEKRLETPRTKPKPKLHKKRRRIPWLRIVLAIVYLGVIVWLIRYERDAHELLYSAQEMENNQEYKTAFETYREVIEGFGFSVAVVEARESLHRIKEMEGLDLPDLSVSPTYDVYWLPFVAWPICAVLLLVVFVTRILRPGVAFLALLLSALAICGSIAQLAYYRVISFQEMAEIGRPLLEEPEAAFVASYVLLFVTGMMTLTATRKVALQSRIASTRVK